MTPEEHAKLKGIFMHAVEQAIANGMTSFPGCEGELYDTFIKALRATFPLQNDLSLIDNMIKYYGFYTVVLSDQFCKAFFPEGKVKETGHAIFYKPDGSIEFERDYSYDEPLWMWHRKMMIQYPNPLTYLEPFLQEIQKPNEWK